MINRPKTLVHIECAFVFNGLIIEEIEIDLEHINYGKSKRNMRSNYDSEFVSGLCRMLLANKNLESVGERTFNDEICSYYKVEDFFEKTKLRVVVCVCSDKPNTLGVLTLYKVKD